MSDKDVIEPAGIPMFTGNLEQLGKDAAALAKQAGEFRDGGSNVHQEFQGLSACYQAPEAEQLFATTLPVKTKADDFADDLEKAAAALTEYEGVVRPLVAKLQSLRTEAFAFTDSIAGDDHWRRDQKKIDHNTRLMHDVGATVAAFTDAERACHDKITALVGGSTLTVDDGSHKPGMYGYSADALTHAEETPWGGYAEREYTGLAWAWHQVKSFVWDGFIVDGIWGTIKGLGTLVGTDGWDKAGQAWTGLAKLATGLAISSTPFWMTPDKDMPSWLRDSRTAMKETGKALVAWDEWGKNPARAAGGVTFNVLTTVFTGGAGSAAKGGAVAKVLSVTGKVAKIVDPMTYVAKAGTFGIIKVGDLFTGLKNVTSGAYTNVLAGGGRFNLDGTYAKNPDVPVVKGNYIEWPGGSRLNLDNGKVYKPDGTISPAKVELSADDITRLKSSLPHVGETVPTGVKERVLVGAGDRTEHGATAHAAAGGPAAHDGGAAAHTTPSTAGHAASHSPHSDSGSGTGSHTPPDSGGSHTPSGSGGGHGSDTTGDHSEPHSPDHGTGSPNESGTAPGERANEPVPELTPEERAGHWGHLDEVEKRAPEEFDHLKHDPDHRGKITNDSMDEARVGLDLREQGRLPADIRRPEVADQGEFYSETTGKYYDIKGIHSFWPPFNNVRNPALLARPFPGAYNPAKHAQTWVETFTEQIDDMHRVVIIDIRNADQAAIDSIKGIVESHGWGENVIWYP
uniref:Protein phosphatase n=1 Tax=Streptomyces sp. NBC_00003 TaxID=2903608 RepID=A0AAU2V259_9ACTN